MRCDHSTALRHAGHFSLFNVIALSQCGLGKNLSRSHDALSADARH